MKKIIFSTIVLFLFAGSANAKMTIASDDFKDGQMISSKNVYNGFGCEGQNISPQISIGQIPAGTKSLAVTIYDPDAPTGSGWWHLIAYNIDSNKSNIRAGELGKVDKISYGKNDYGSFNYGGPCPPVGHGNHRYILTVHALKVEKLDFPQNSTSALIGFNINANTIEKASITALYKR